MVDVDSVAALLERDSVNGYGITMPLSFHSNINESLGVDTGNADVTTLQQEDTTNKMLRGTALYSHASRINHECLPNVARFDDFDAPSSVPGDNMTMSFRAMHALPGGEEITQSYFPLPWTFVERQTRLADQFGFECVCPRCREERSWPRDEQEDAMYQSCALAQFHHASTPPVIPPAQQDYQADPAYIHLFLLKYVCPVDGCSGTMAPIDQTDDMHCNVCGMKRSEKEFLEEVERDMQQQE